MSQVRHEQNLTLSKIRTTLDKVSIEDHSDRDMLAGKNGLKQADLHGCVAVSRPHFSRP